MPCARFITVPQPAYPFHLKRSQPEFSFNPFLEILSAVEKELGSSSWSSSHQVQQAKRRKTVINPRFDVRETEDAFFVEGELPGVSNKEAVEIQFTDAQTLTVKGEITRRSHVATATAVTGESDTEEQVVVIDRPASPAQSLKPTVEDQVDESESMHTPSSGTLSDVGVTATEKPAVAEKTNTQDKKEKVKEQTPKVKHWLRERSVGVFERSFEFQSLIDPEGVKASLEDGILEIRIPKKQPYVRKVQIQ